MSITGVIWLNISKLNQKTRIKSYIIFGFAISIAILSTVSIFFPALIAVSTTESVSNIEPFELGSWFNYLVITYLIIAAFAVLHFGKMLPQKITNSIKFILKFEVSPKVATITVIVLLVAFIGFNIPEFEYEEGEKWRDIARIQLALVDFPYSEEASSVIKRLYVKNFLLYTSQELFGSIRIIPFIASIALLLLTYFFTVKLTEKRFAGLIAMSVLAQSYVFSIYDTLGTYSNFWVLFYLFSLYTMFTKWFISPISFVLSAFSKPLTILFLPITFFFIYNADIPKRKKIFLTVSYVVIVAAMGGALVGLQMVNENSVTLDSVRFWSGFTAIAMQLRFDGFVMLLLVPLTIALFLISRRGIRNADSLLVLIMFTLFSSTIIAGISDYNIHPYRFMPFIVFFSVGIGALFSKGIISQEH